MLSFTTSAQGYSRVHSPRERRKEEKGEGKRGGEEERREKREKEKIRKRDKTDACNTNRLGFGNGLKQSRLGDISLGKKMRLIIVLNLWRPLNN